MRRTGLSEPQEKDNGEKTRANGTLITTAYVVAVVADGWGKEQAVNRKAICISTAVLAFVWLGACDRGDERVSRQPGPVARVEAGPVAMSSGIPGVLADSSWSHDAAFGTCTDEPQIIAECEAPLTEPDTQPATSLSETVCTATRHGTEALAGTDATTAGSTDASVSARLEHLLAASSTLEKRCDKASSSTPFETSRKRHTPDESTTCSCGMKRCLCG